MIESTLKLISLYGALPFAAVLLFYSFKHTDYPLKSACALSATLYIFCFMVSWEFAGHPWYFKAFLLIDFLWLMALWKLCRVSRLIVAAFGLNFLVLSVANTLLEKHWLFHGYYYYLYTALSLLFVASLTVLPQKYPLVFASPYDERDDDRDCASFFLGIPLKNFRNFLSSRGI